MEAGDCFLSETQTRGSVFVENAKDHPEWMCGNGSMSWDLCIDKKYQSLGLALLQQPHQHHHGQKTLHGLWKLKRVMRLVGSYPEEALWEPVFRVYHLGWRMLKGY